MGRPLGHRNQMDALILTAQVFQAGLGFGERVENLKCVETRAAISAIVRLLTTPTLILLIQINMKNISLQIKRPV